MSLNVPPLLFELLWQQLLQITMVALVGLFIVRVFGKQRPQLGRVVIGLVLLKCIVPPVVAFPLSPFSWLEYPTLLASTDREPNVGRYHANAVVPASDSLSLTKPSSVVARSVAEEVALPERQYSVVPPTNAGSIDTIHFETLVVPWWRWLFFAWLVTAALVLVVTVGRIAAFFWRVCRCEAAEDQALAIRLNDDCQNLSALLGLSPRRRRRTKVLVIDAMIGPSVVGVFRPRILLPKIVVERSTAEQVQILLAHELVHIRRHDLAWAIVQVIALSAWWFHPLIRLASRWFDNEAERCCDEETIMRLGCRPGDYARCLLKVLELKHQLQVAPALPGVRPVDITAKRMERIMRLRNGCYQERSRWCSLAIVLGAALLIPGATWSAAQEDPPQALPPLSVDESDEVPAPLQQSLNAGVNDAATASNDPLVSIQLTFVTLPTDELPKIQLDWVPQVPGILDHDKKISYPTHKFVKVVGSTNIAPNSQPLLVARVEASRLQQLNEQLAGNLQANNRMAPRIVVASGSEAMITDAVERPFVVGLEEITRDFAKAQQPIVQIVPDGINVAITPVIHDEAISLSATLQLAQVKNVGVLTYRRTGEAVNTGTTLQVPHVVSANFHYEASALKKGESVVLATLRPGSTDEVLLVIASPQIVLQVQPGLPKSELQSRLEELLEAKEQTSQLPRKLSILGPMTSGEEITVLDPPSDAEVWAVLEKYPQFLQANGVQTLVGTTLKTVVLEKIDVTVQPEKFYPLVGKARLHSTQYRCTVVLQAVPADQAAAREFKLVFPLEHSHFHLGTFT